MLICNIYDIGAKLLSLRKSTGLTQSEVAEKAGISDRTYADIERGMVNMRIETLMKICHTFHITPDEILTEQEITVPNKDELLDKLNACSLKEQKTALELLEVYLKSLD